MPIDEIALKSSWKGITILSVSIVTQFLSRGRFSKFHWNADVRFFDLSFPLRLLDNSCPMNKWTRFEIQKRLEKLWEFVGNYVIFCNKDKKLISNLTDLSLAWREI